MQHQLIAYAAGDILVYDGRWGLADSLRVARSRPEKTESVPLEAFEFV
jgi:hypothetical protein